VNRFQIKGGERGDGLGPPSFRDAVRASFKSFALNFCIVLLKSSSITLELHLISSEASHMFVKTKQKLCASVPKAAPHFNVQTQNNLKSNGFKQFTM